MQNAILITGAAKRIGRMIALRLAGDGYDTILHYHQSADDIKTLQQEIQAMGRSASLFQANLLETQPLAESFKNHCMAHEILPIGVINSASSLQYDVFEDATSDQFNHHFHINCCAPILLMQAAVKLRDMMANQDCQLVFINLLDFKLSNPAPDYFTYSLSKFGLREAGLMLAKSLAHKNVRVCSISPGYSLPKAGQDQAEFDEIHKQTPLGYGVGVNEIADSVIFILKTPSLTGQDIIIDCGLRFRALNKDISFGIE